MIHTNQMIRQNDSVLLPNPCYVSKSFTSPTFRRSWLNILLS